MENEKHTTNVFDYLDYEFSKRIRYLDTSPIIYSIHNNEEIKKCLEWMIKNYPAKLEFKFGDIDYDGKYITGSIVIQLDNPYNKNYAFVQMKKNGIVLYEKNDYDKKYITVEHIIYLKAMLFKLEE